jgi:hypothetical protein
MDTQSEIERKIIIDPDQGTTVSNRRFGWLGVEGGDDGCRGIFFTYPRDDRRFSTDEIDSIIDSMEYDESVSEEFASSVVPWHEAAVTLRNFLDEHAVVEDE